MRGSLTPRKGDTPYLRVGNWLAIGLAGFILAGAALEALIRRRVGTIKPH
jgi:apolipoprotein N-acyltransferase